MPKIEHVSFVKAPRSFVFGQLANSENLPKMVGAYKSVRIVGRERNAEVVEAEVETFGTKAKGTLRRVYHPDDRIEESLESDLATGTNILTLDDVPEGTRIRYSADFTLKGALAWVLGPLVTIGLRNAFAEDSERTKRFIESRSTGSTRLSRA